MAFKYRKQIWKKLEREIDESSTVMRFLTYLFKLLIEQAENNHHGFWTHMFNIYKFCK